MDMQIPTSQMLKPPNQIDFIQMTVTLGNLI